MHLLAVAQEPGVVLLGLGRVDGVRVAEECHGSGSPHVWSFVPYAIFAKGAAPGEASCSPGAVL
ncbi:hypothetical protein GCM10010267_01880 [Streptomyces griseorubens]|nr:hypothetical protein GCM10010267_01880 [Streptomyces griseorubens]